MTRPRTLALALAAACASTGALAAPSMAVVGGHDTSNAAYHGVAKITFGGFQCTGTLIAPQWVLTAGHCGSLTGAAVASPVGWPAPLIDVQMGATQESALTSYSVSEVVVEPGYLLTDGYDISLLKLTAPATGVPAIKVSGAAEKALWSAGTLETIVGWGLTEEGGDEAPTVLQEAQVPIVADADCAAAYGSFEPQTQICAGYPQGGIDTCQGDSGGPMFGQTTAGELRVVGTTSYGEGCARPNRPGVYARVGDDTLRTWIASVASEGVATQPAAKAKKAKKAKKKAKRARSHA